MGLLRCSLILALTTLVQLSQATTEDESTSHSHVYKSEKDLRAFLFRDYDKLSRPAKRATTAVPVQVGISPLIVDSMNEVDQVISIQTFMKMIWTDEYLQWDPNDYDNITVLQVPATEVWKPDISLYTASLDTGFFPSVQTNAIIFHTGKMIWVPPFTVSSRCPIPFANHATSKRTFIECNIRMGSWTHSELLLDLQLQKEKVDLAYFRDTNYDWKFVKMVAGRESKYYPCCPEPYPYVDFNITLKRRNNHLNSEDDN